VARGGEYPRVAEISVGIAAEDQDLGHTFAAKLA
jgi:hypothetical protein